MEVEGRHSQDLTGHDVEMGSLILPDDFLLAVLGHLNTTELFSARLVCRRFRDLCLHPQLWKTRSLDRDSYIRAGICGFGLPRAVLCLAPCLRRLSLSPGQCTRLAPLVSSISCSVSKLNIDLATLGETSAITCDSAQDFITIVQKLASVGGLTELGLCLALDNPSPTLARAVLETIYTINGLKCLFIGGEIPLSTNIPANVDVQPSLTKLNYRALGGDAGEGFPFIGSLLKAHASTLEEVIVELHDVPLSPLQRSSKLRSLTIFPHRELPLLLGCPNLSTVELLYSDECSWVFPDETIEFFRRAVSLRSVTFPCPRRDPAAPLLALAGSKAAERVQILDVMSVSPDVITLLEMALYKFSSLRKLTFQGKVTDDFLYAVDPSVTPNLTSLTIDDCHDGSPCAHSWLHGPSIQDLFARNPQLRLYINEWHGRYRRECTCRWCLWGCHSDFEEPLEGFSSDYI